MTGRDLLGNFGKYSPVNRAPRPCLITFLSWLGYPSHSSLPDCLHTTAREPLGLVCRRGIEKVRSRFPLDVRSASSGSVASPISQGDFDWSEEETPKT